MKGYRIFTEFKVCFILILLLFGSQLTWAQEENKDSEEKEKKSMFRDPEDGAFDVSRFLAKPVGFMPVPIIITEPAIGYGGGLGLLYFHKRKKEYDKPVPPSISGIAGMGTQNKTWVLGLFHFHVWGPDKVRTITGAGKATIHIKYYGNNNDYLSKNPVEITLDAWAALQRVQVRIAETDLFVGGSYVFFTTNNSVDTLPDRPIVNKILKRLNGKSTLSILQPMINWDSRNNIFTPTKGMNTGVVFSYNASWLGADLDYYLLNPYYLGYLPISKRVFSGWRMDASFMLGDAPLYALPFIDLRGVPAMQYQSNNTMLVETEWRFNLYKRWSLNSFAGTGKAFTSFDQFGSATWVYNYGLGFRYELARAMGVFAGIDFAFSNNNEFAFYIIFGSAWMK